MQKNAAARSVSAIVSDQVCHMLANGQGAGQSRRLDAEEVDQPGHAMHGWTLDHEIGQYGAQGPVTSLACLALGFASGCGPAAGGTWIDMSATLARPLQNTSSRGAAFASLLRLEKKGG